MPVFRPIQYLGNKLRVIEQIGDAADVLVGKDGRVADLFTGSTVVAQAFAGRGYNVTAVDCQAYSRVLAIALLSIRRKRNETCPTHDILAHPLYGGPRRDLRQWEEFAVIEEEILADSDIRRLRTLYRRLPLVWRCDRSRQTPLVKGQAVRNQHCGGTDPIITPIYAGSYFGIRQSLELDKIRHAISSLHGAGSISYWQMNALLGALLTAASASVHSAGKHFAQPLTTANSSASAFKDARLLKDRTISIREEFVRGALAIDGTDYGQSNHHAFTGAAEDFVATTPDQFDLYYLDPPYTAQQYSRFYHILETLCTYDFPVLTCDDRTSIGLYPINRYKSAFCSKRKASSALESIVRKAKGQGVHLLISYSHSHPGSNGNARMISLECLLRTCRHEYGDKSVDVSTLAHRYRQFNSGRSAKADRSDPEVLVTCRID